MEELQHLHCLCGRAKRGDVGNPISTNTFSINPCKAFGHGAHVKDNWIIA